MRVESGAGDAFLHNKKPKPKQRDVLPRYFEIKWLNPSRNYILVLGWFGCLNRSPQSKFRGVAIRVVLDSFFRADSTLTHMTIQVTQLRLNSNSKMANMTQLRLNSKPKFTNLTQL